MQIFRAGEAVHELQLHLEACARTLHAIQGRVSGSSAVDYSTAVRVSSGDVLCSNSRRALRTPVARARSQPARQL